MHPRSPYAAFTDFGQLAVRYPDLRKFLTRFSSLDFQDPTAVRELAKCLLHRDFGLSVELAPDRLCPMIPNRFEYVLWIQDLLDSTSGCPIEEFNPHRKVVGLDVGTGASCIYSMLACAHRKSWRMIGTDIDEISVCFARNIVSTNSDVLQSRIRIEQVCSEDPLLPLDMLGIERLDITMCNPPFYDSLEEMLQSARSKALPPSSACTGTMNEMVYSDDGELGFARRMLSESLLLRERVQWYTITFGKLTSVKTLVSDIKSVPDLGGNWAVTEFVQGKTKRWGVGWSFCDKRPTGAVALISAAALKGYNPFPPEFRIRSLGSNFSCIRAICEGFQPLRWELRDKDTMWCEFSRNVWSRSSRRQAHGESPVSTTVQLGVVIMIDNSGATVRWTKGRDSVIFESFCGALKRKIQQP